MAQDMEKIQLMFEDSFLPSVERFLHSRIDYAITIYARECRDAISLERMGGRSYIKDIDRDYLTRLIEEQFFKAVDAYQHRILGWLQEIFNDWFKDLDTLAEMHPSGSRYLTIIVIERYLASQVHHFITLDHWVIGNYKSYFRGWLHSHGIEAIPAILLEDIDIPEGEFKAQVMKMLPSPGKHLIPTMFEWSKEFFASAYRFCDSMRKNLHLLSIEAEHIILKPFGRNLKMDIT